MEQTSGRECVWAAGQYLSYAKPGEVMDVDVTLAVEGHQITQARAVCHVGNREILTVNAALGHRDDGARRGQWETMPDVRPAGTSTRDRAASDAGRRHDQRAPRAADGEGRDLDDARRHARRRPDAAVGAHPRRDRGRRRHRRWRSSATSCRWASARRSGCAAAATASTTRCGWCELVPTEWVLLDIRVHAVERGFGHGLVHMFAEDGTLLATASQSCIVRFWKGSDDEWRRACRRKERTTDHDCTIAGPRPGMTVPLPGPLHSHREKLAELADLGYTDIWSAETDGADAFTPLALAAAWEPRLRLGTAIVPAYTRSPACFAQSVASMADAAPGRFAIGIGSSSNVIVERWNGVPFVEPYKKVRDVVRFLKDAFERREGVEAVRHVQQYVVVEEQEEEPLYRRSASASAR